MKYSLIKFNKAINKHIHCYLIKQIARTQRKKLNTAAIFHRSKYLLQMIDNDPLGK